MVVDAASLGGSSGGPAFNRRGELVGMLWGGPVHAATVRVGRGTARVSTGIENPSFAYLLHTRTIANELRRLGGFGSMLGKSGPRNHLDSGLLITHLVRGDPHPEAIRSNVARN